MVLEKIEAKDWAQTILAAHRVNAVLEKPKYESWGLH